MDAHRSRWVCVARVANLRRAQVLAARLRADRIDVRVHGEAVGPYPVTVGGLAPAELWVPAEQVEEADRLLLEADVTEVVEGFPTPSLHGPPLGHRLVAVLLVLTVVGTVVLRLMRVF